MSRYVVPVPDPADTGVNFRLLANSTSLDWAGLSFQSYQLPAHPELVPPTISPSPAIHLHLRTNTELRGRVDGRPYRGLTYPGLSILTPQDAPFAFAWDDEVQVINIFVTPELVTNLAGEVSHGDPLRTQLTWHFNFQDALVQAVSQALLAELHSDAPLGPLYAESLSQTLVLHLIRHYSHLSIVQPIPPQPLSRRQLQRVLDYIGDNYRSNLRLADLAAVAGLSPAHFSRQFKQATGRAPHQYLLRHRVERARDLLASGQLNVAEVAQLVGFADQSHLTRHFKRHLGYLPRDVLRNNKRQLR